MALSSLRSPSPVCTTPLHRGGPVRHRCNLYAVQRTLSGAHAAAAGGGDGHLAQQQQQPGRRDALLRTLLAGLATVGSGTTATAARAATDSTAARVGEVRHTKEEWEAILGPDAYAVMREAATERRFSSPLYGEHRRGTYVCTGCEAPLFSSAMKYESGTGWPSFTNVLPGAVDQLPDYSIPFMPRTEVRCHRCQGHLGHVFDDGPAPTRLRYCMNGLSLKFIAEE